MNFSNNLPASIAISLFLLALNISSSTSGLALTEEERNATLAAYMDTMNTRFGRTGQNFAEREEIVYIAPDATPLTSADFLPQDYEVFMSNKPSYYPLECLITSGDEFEKSTWSDEGRRGRDHHLRVTYDPETRAFALYFDDSHYPSHFIIKEHCAMESDQNNLQKPLKNSYVKCHAVPAYPANMWLDVNLGKRNINFIPYFGTGGNGPIPVQHAYLMKQQVSDSDPVGRLQKPYYTEAHMFRSEQQLVDLSGTYSPDDEEEIEHIRDHCLPFAHDGSNQNRTLKRQIEDLLTHLEAFKYWQDRFPEAYESIGNK